MNRQSKTLLWVAAVILVAAAGWYYYVYSTNILIVNLYVHHWSDIMKADQESKNFVLDSWRAYEMARLNLIYGIILSVILAVCAFFAGREKTFNS